MRNIVKALTQLHRCEQGAEGLEKLLIVGAIALPILGVLIAFRGRLVDLMSSAWEAMTGKGNPTDAGTANTP